MLESGEHLSRKFRVQNQSPLMYEWYQEQYVGAAHGLAGIYYFLMQVEQDPGFRCKWSSLVLVQAIWEIIFCGFAVIRCTLWLCIMHFHSKGSMAAPRTLKAEVIKFSVLRIKENIQILLLV